jgi:hypothetical protein
MGGVVCHSSSSKSGCTSSYLGNSVLNAGAIVGIVIGSLASIGIIIFLLVLSYKLLKRKHNPSCQERFVNVHGFPLNINNNYPLEQRVSAYIPSDIPAYYPANTKHDYYENA